MNRYDFLDAYLLAKPGAEKDYKAEWDWFRYRVHEKMFAAVCTPGSAHPLHAGRTMLMLKCDPALAELLRAQYPDVIPGFYCNKRCWNSVYLDGDVPAETLRAMCDQSYALVAASLPKRVQAALSARPDKEA